MPTTNRRGDWISFGTEPRVRLLECDALRWSQAPRGVSVPSDFTQCLVATGPMGGHTAVVKKAMHDVEDGNADDGAASAAPTKLAASDAGVLIPSTIQLFRADGVHIADIEEDAQVFFMCFNELNDDLIVVMETGDVRFYTSTGGRSAHDRSCGKPALCSSTACGVAIVTHDMELLIFQYDPQMVRRAGMSRSATTTAQDEAAAGALAKYDCYAANLTIKLGPDLPAAMLAIPRELSTTDNIRIILAPPEVDETTATCLHVFQTLPRAAGMDGDGRYKCEPEPDSNTFIDGGAITRMTLAPNGGKIATLSSSGAIHITTQELRSFHKVASTQSMEPPAQFCWCGNSVVAYVFLTSQFPDDPYETTLSLFCVEEPGLLRPGGSAMATVESLRDVPDDVFLAVESDSIRLLSLMEPDRHKVLQAIPSFAVRLYHRASSAPSAQLVRAYDMFEDGDPASVKALRQLLGVKDNGTDLLLAAIVDCVQSASFEMDTEQQQRLLRIASYGKTFCSVFDTADFTAACRRIRAWNAVRSAEVGMLLSMPQFIVQEQSGRLLKRLVSLGKFALANEIALWLGLHARNEVVEGWAKAKIDSSLTRVAESERDRIDVQIASVVLGKLRQCPNVRYTEIARHAFSRNREVLFRLLLEEEPSPEKHITELLRQKDYSAALSKAVQFIDPDLIYSCLIQMAGIEGATFERFAPAAPSHGVGAAAGGGATGAGGKPSLQQRDRMAHDMWLVVVRHVKFDERKRYQWLFDSPVVPIQQALFQYFADLKRVRRNLEDVVAIQHDPDHTLQDTVGAFVVAMKNFVQQGGGVAARAGGGGGADQIRSSIARLASSGAAVVGSGAGGAGGGVTNVAAAMESMGELTAALAKQRELARMQRELMDRLLPGDRNYPRRGQFIGATVAKTLELCHQFKFPDKTVEELKSKFNVPEKVATWSKLKGLVAAQEFEKIIEMGRGRGKLAIGYGPIVSELINANQRKAATEFIPKVPNLVDRLELHVLCGEWKAAAQDCIRNKEAGLIEQLRERARGQSDALQSIDEAVAGR